MAIALFIRQGDSLNSVLAGDGVGHSQLGIEAAIALPKPANWLLAPVECFSKLCGVMVVAFNRICDRCASSHGFDSLPALTLAQRQAVEAIAFINS
jgi:hypothetical protein